MGTTVEFIVAQSVVQQGGTMCSGGVGRYLPETVRGDHMFCHRQSVGTTYSATDSRGGGGGGGGGDQLKYDSTIDTYG